MSSDMLHSSQRLKGSVNYGVRQNDVKDLLEAKELPKLLLASTLRARQPPNLKDPGALRIRTKT